MPYTIEFTDVAADELRAIKKFNREKIITAVDQQLTSEPTVQTKNRKMLTGFHPNFEHNPPVWELRVGQYRVFYDVSEESTTVTVRAVRQKPPHKTTEQIA